MKGKGTAPSPVGDQSGIAILVAMVMLLLLTIIGTAAVETSNTEIMISTVERTSEGTFCAAEAGLDHARAILQGQFVTANEARLAAGGTPDWDFALNGSLDGVDPAAASNAAQGALLISARKDDLGHTYDVVVWNNLDGGGATNDVDSLVFVRSTATGPGGARSEVEILVQGQIRSGTGSSDYDAQDGGGASKSHANDDRTDITTFQKQF